MKIALIGTGEMGKKYAAMLGNQLSSVVCSRKIRKNLCDDVSPETL